MCVCVACYIAHIIVSLSLSLSTTAIFYFMRAFTSRRVANFVVLGSLSFGMANLIFYYTVEIAARIYCPRQVSKHCVCVSSLFSSAADTERVLCSQNV